MVSGPETFWVCCTQKKKNKLHSQAAVHNWKRRGISQPCHIVRLWERTIGCWRGLVKRRITFKRPNTIFQCLRNDKPPIHPSLRSGVYRIPVKKNILNREEVYIGWTRRNLGTRIKEHQQDIMKGKTNTTLGTRVWAWPVYRLARGQGHPKL